MYTFSDVLWPVCSGWQYTWAEVVVCGWVYVFGAFQEYADPKNWKDNGTSVRTAYYSCTWLFTIVSQLWPLMDCSGLYVKKLVHKELSTLPLKTKGKN